MTSSLTCSTTLRFMISDFGRTYAAVKAFTQNVFYIFNNTWHQYCLLPTLTAKILSWKTSFTFRMGPQEPLAMKPRICGHTHHYPTIFITFVPCSAVVRSTYPEMVLLRKYTQRKLRHEERSWSPLCTWCLGSVLWRQQGFRSWWPVVWPHRPTKFSWVSKSLSEGDPHVWEDHMTEATPKSCALSL